MEIDDVVMKDSLQFLNCSLDKQVTNLAEKGKKDGKTLMEILPTTYSYFKEKWGEVGQQAFELSTRKGIYPYEYMDSFKRLSKRKLPEKEKYCSILKREGITDDEYEFA